MATYGEVAYLRLPSGQSGTHIIRSTVPVHPDFSFEIRHHIPADPAAAAVALLTASPSKVEFWPVSRCRTDDGLVFDATSAHLMQDRVINSVIVGASGVYALLATSGSVATGAPLGLLRYVAGAGSAPVYRPLALAVPWLTMYTNEGQMVLDDHLGLILSVRGDGKLRIISYG
ncbi:hypothetical protein B0H11DRAFT_1345535 [Mycena galericulata]|nr:hypothetical protein B0H11DRAFT_1345535 [Mycena galericulata]